MLYAASAAELKGVTPRNEPEKTKAKFSGVLSFFEMDVAILGA